MKNMKLCAILIFAFITLTNAQWLETTIYVPDSLCGIHNPRAFTYNDINNTIYVGGSGNCVIAIDGTTNEKIARIPAGEGIQALCWNSINNKVYCANWHSNNVTVIDAATNAVITTIGVGYEPRALVYNPTNNKVYCANEYSGNVTVIDGATNAVITTIPVGDLPCALVYNSTNNKVYCANEYSGNVTVIDGAMDSVIVTITVGDEPIAFTWNPIQNRTYVANCLSSSISVIRDVTGIEENKTSIVESNGVGVTIFSGPLLLPEGKQCKVFDITGRVVVPDKIKPGIYFVEVDGKITRKVVKVR